MSVEISVIIVNYNVRVFLQQCLYSVYKASKDVSTEVIVVDNNSVDGSNEMIRQNFPKVKLIANKENNGFAFGCNQGIKESQGKYILLLNPDTVIKEDSLKLCRDFMQKTPNAGALGVKMINGKGKFLPESKRSLPNAQSAFFKIFGLSVLFPKSKLFGQYQLKYLNEDEIHEVEVLSGAFMFIRKFVLDKIGLLDENFFMYGEDIDLSYRVLQAGYKNYYFSNTTIIHYKGESTKKASFKYVKIFYNAMLIFANKHYKGKRQYFFRLLIKFAIYIRAIMALIKRAFDQIYLPLLDFILIYASYLFIVPLWEEYKFSSQEIYSKNLSNIYIPIYILIWQFLVYHFTNYEIKIKYRKLVYAISIGTIIILAIYSLLPENYRYSRALIIIGAISSLILISSNRLIISILKNGLKGFTFNSKKNALLIGSKINDDFISHPDSLKDQYEIRNLIKFDGDFLNSKEKVSLILENIQIHKIDTLIFFIKNLSVNDIINTILSCSDKKLEFKIVLPGSSSMIGPQSVMDLEKIPHLKLNPISKPLNRVKKYILDFILTIVFFGLSPLFFVKNKPFKFYRLLWQVFINKKTWVSYTNSENNYKLNLPRLPEGVFNTSLLLNNENKIAGINQSYAKNYRITNDLIIIFKALKSSLKIT